MGVLSVSNFQARFLHVALMLGMFYEFILRRLHHLHQSIMRHCIVSITRVDLDSKTATKIYATKASTYITYVLHWVLGLHYRVFNHWYGDSSGDSTYFIIETNMKARYIVPSEIEIELGNPRSMMKPRMPWMVAVLICGDSKIDITSLLEHYAYSYNTMSVMTIKNLVNLLAIVHKEVRDVIKPGVECTITLLTEGFDEITLKDTDTLHM